MLIFFSVAISFGKKFKIKFFYGNNASNWNLSLSRIFLELYFPSKANWENYIVEKNHFNFIRAPDWWFNIYSTWYNEILKIIFVVGAMWKRGLIEKLKRISFSDSVQMKISLLII